MNTLTLIRRTVLSAMLVVASGAAALAADTFEGRVQMQITSASAKSKDQPHTMEYVMKGDRMRMNMSDVSGNKQNGPQSVGIIVDFKNRQILTLIDSPDRKMVMRHPMAEPKTEGKSDETVPDPVATGRTETIAGYSAAEYTMKDKDGNTHQLWLGKGLGSYMSPSAFQAQRRAATTSPAWEKIVRQGNFFPLRVVTIDPTGKEVSRMEVTKIVKGGVSESEFSTDGYQEFQMPSMKGMFGR